eukprot:1129517-Amphidinium_carterae.1
MERIYSFPLPVWEAKPKGPLAEQATPEANEMPPKVRGAYHIGSAKPQLKLGGKPCAGPFANISKDRGNPQPKTTTTKQVDILHGVSKIQCKDSL